MEYAKVKSVGKYVEVSGDTLDNIVLKTMRTISSVVGGTLGPGGKPVLIERFEHDLPPYLTKDGVTVFKALGLDNSIAHCVMELSRDASARTASEAGDGTTTAAILSEAIVRLMKEYCKTNKRVSPQRIVRHLERTFRDHIEPSIRRFSRTVDQEKDLELLRAVARVSGNGDQELADAVMECFDICGDQGNVTIVEKVGPSGYKTDEVKGYPIAIGYDESCGKFFPKFINDNGRQMVVMERPAFLLYHGKINDIMQLVPLMSQVTEAFERPGNFGLDRPFPYNVVICAIGFSDTVLASLASNFQGTQSINVYPLVVPNNSPQAGAQFEFLLDLAAVTGAKICDVLNKPLVSATLQDMGVGCESFEVNRFRSTVMGWADEFVLQARMDEVSTMLQNPDSLLDKSYLEERLAKLSGGIARLEVGGPSNGERKEKRDRAEDAVCAVRGAIKHGVLPGGAWTLLRLCGTDVLPENAFNDKILRPAFQTPFLRLLENSGFVLESDEVAQVLSPILEGIKAGTPVTYDFLEQKHVDPYEGGLLDSTPAVLEAVRNAISSASQIGTLGGCVVFKRDGELERSEAKATADWVRNANYNPADERI